MSPLRYAPHLALALACLVSPAHAKESDAFRFESIASLDDMRTLIRERFGKSSDKADLRHIFVSKGGGTLIIHPTAQPRNISTTSTCATSMSGVGISAPITPPSGTLQQVYVNGEPALDVATADPLMPVIDENKSGAGVYRMARPRPEASKGENSLGFILIDADGNLDTAGDQLLVGGEPTRADPNNLGTLHGYKAAPWRSIFDSDAARVIVPFGGQCPAAPPG